MKGSRLVACAVFSLTVARTAHAQQPITEWPGFQWQAADRHLYEGIRDYAQCVVDVKPAEVEAVLALPIGGSGERDLSSKLVEDTQRCVELIAVRMDPRVFRGALIEALYQRDFQRAKGSKATVHLGQADERLQLANCVTRADEKTADRLLLTSPASPQQAQIYQQLSPVLDACHASALPPEDPQILRYEIAEALYRLRSGGESVSEMAK